jgi:hypothetical protein
MLHGPAAEQKQDPAAAYKTRLGAKMFVLYALIYAGFVAINLIWPRMMGAVVALGLNLAVFYGFSLIAFALILAVIFNAMCLRMESKLARERTGERG